MPARSVESAVCRLRGEGEKATEERAIVLTLKAQPCKVAQGKQRWPGGFGEREGKRLWSRGGVCGAWWLPIARARLPISQNRSVNQCAGETRSDILSEPGEAVSDPDGAAARSLS